MTPLKQIIRRKLNSILDRIIGSEEPDITVSAKELLETLCDCIRILADFDEDDGEEGQLYRRCLALLAQLSLKLPQDTHDFIIKP